MTNAPGTNLAERLRAALDDAQDAINGGDAQARGYAEGKALSLKRDIAKLDPRGVGHKYLPLLSEGERNDAAKYESMRLTDAEVQKIRDMTGPATNN